MCYGIGLRLLYGRTSKADDWSVVAVVVANSRRFHFACIEVLRIVDVPMSKAEMS